MGKARSPRRAAFAPRLIVMAKTPQAGRVKRRLAREIGVSAATQFARACLTHTLLRLGMDPRWRTFLGVTPDSAVTATLWSPIVRQGRIERLPQGRGDLGRRMQALFERLPPGPAIIVGSDIPGIGRAEIAEAFRLLGNAQAVLGPAPDGGYWLVGLKGSPRRVAPFAKVRWSSPHALADTLGNLAGSRVAFAATLSDVDDAENYRRLRGQWQRLIPRRLPA
jgi:rSAM/selenodomain-associated transferase 1